MAEIAAESDDVDGIDGVGAWFDRLHPPPPDPASVVGCDEWAAPIPDAVDLVVEAASMMAVFASERFERVHVMHREALG